MAIDDSIDSYTAGREIAIANEVYKRVFELAEQDLMTMVSFRERSGNLLAYIKNSHEAIQKAESALQHLQGAFSKLETDLDLIQKQLGYAKGYVQKSDPQRRKGALRQLDRASDLWVKVQRFAANFQRNGLVVQADMKKELEKPPQVPPSLEILNSNYGGNDVTIYSRIIFNDGADLSVPSFEPGFPEAWEGVTKSISLLHSYGGEKRIFVCGEYSGTHKIKRGPIKNSQNSASVCNVVNPFPKPDGAAAQIIAIVWGKQEVRDQKVYNYCYERLTKGEKITWLNDTMGGDTWYGVNKSGVIYYTVDGGISVKQTAGREFTETDWRA